ETEVPGRTVDIVDRPGPSDVVGAASPADLELHGLTVDEVVEVTWFAVVERRGGAVVVEPVADTDRCVGSVEGDELRVGRIVAPSGGQGREHSGGRPARILAGEGGGECHLRDVVRSRQGRGEGGRVVAFQEGGVDVPGEEFGMPEDPHQQV